jgi:hypothetical protein
MTRSGVPLCPCAPAHMPIPVGHFHLARVRSSSQTRLLTKTRRAGSSKGMTSAPLMSSFSSVIHLPRPEHTCAEYVPTRGNSCSKALRDNLNSALRLRVVELRQHSENGRKSYEWKWTSRNQAARSPWTAKLHSSGRGPRGGSAGGGGRTLKKTPAVFTWAIV